MAGLRCAQRIIKALSLLFLTDLLLTLVGVTTAFPTSVSGKTFRDLDICSHWNGRRHFLELGDRGELHARNVTMMSSKSFRSTAPLFGGVQTTNRSAINTNNGGGAVWYQQCNLELVTCAECVVRITFSYVNFSRTCTTLASPLVDDDDDSSSSTNAVLTAPAPASNMRISSPSLSCPCDYVQFSEPPYDVTLSGHDFCGDGKVFRSRTRTLLLKFFYRAPSAHVFSLQYFSERNVKIISGSPHQTILSHLKKQSVPSLTPAHIISTPYFPIPYPRDYVVEHVLSCEAENCHVRLEFTDFQLGLTSSLEVFDSNGQMLDAYSGEHFRPPIFTSTGKSLLLQFRGEGASGVGFRAEIYFISSRQLSEEHWPTNTDCGGMVTGPGGAVTMMDMINNTTDPNNSEDESDDTHTMSPKAAPLLRYDCIWLIKPSNNYMMMKTHISLRVADFHGMAARSELEVRLGTTSSGQLVEHLTWPPTITATTASMSTTPDNILPNHIAPILTGFYVRLRGLFGRSSKLSIVYSVFNYMNCYIGSEFLCGNKHCISIRLHCDGFDHCGDGSDEPPSCETDWVHLHQDRRWYSHKSNYYFPKTEEPYPDLKMATGIFIVSTIGIFSVLTAWMIILYRMGVRARHQRHLQNQLQTISEFLEDRQDDLPIGGNGNHNGPDEPPIYEAPPDYDEVIKVGMEEALRCGHHNPETRNQHRHQRQQRHLAVQRQQRQCCHLNSNIMTVALPEPVRGTILEGGGECASTSTEAAGGADPLQFNRDLVQRVLWATSACGSHFKNGTSQATLVINKNNNNTTTTASSSRPTSQPEEERSEGFRDDSLNISFSLNNTSSIATTSNNNYTDPATSISMITPKTLETNDGNSADTLFRRSWLSLKPDISAVNFNGRGFVAGVEAAHTYRLQRLRHTFSSPDTFAGLVGAACVDCDDAGTDFGYTTDANELKLHNLNDRHAPSPCPIHRCNCSQMGLPTVTSAEIFKSSPNTPQTDSNLVTAKDSLLKIKTDIDSDFEESGDGASSSCFGGGINKLRFRHARSKSLTNGTMPTKLIGYHHNSGSGGGTVAIRNNCLKRSSSADLLLLCSNGPATPNLSQKLGKGEMLPVIKPILSTEEECDGSSSKDCIFLI